MVRYTPSTTQELRELVRNPQVHLGEIDVSKISDFSFLFSDALDTESNKYIAHDRYDYSGIETWNVANAVTMQGMFAGCRYFDADLKKWDVSKVKNMASMFEGCVYFDRPVTFETASVTNTSRMFKDCYALSSNVTLDLSRVTEFQDMFLGAQNFEPDEMLHTLKTRNNHFKNPKHFNSLETASYFLQLERKNKRTGQYEPHSVAELRVLLSTGITLKSIDSRKLNSLRGAFATGNEYLEICKEVRNPHLPLVTDIKIDNWEDLQKWDVNHIEDFRHCFAGQHDLDHVPFTGMKNARQCDYMFADCWSLKSINLSNLTSNELNADNIFKNTGIVFTKDYKFNRTPSSNLYDEITDVTLAQKIALRALKVGDKYIPKSVQELRILIHNNDNIDFKQIDTSKLTTMSGAFASFDLQEDAYLAKQLATNSKLPTIEKLICCSWQNIDSLEVGHIQDFYSCFRGQTTFNEDISRWNTSQATTMKGMFAECYEFNNPVNFNTAQVTDMSFMFNICTKFNQPVNFDTSKVTNMHAMFSECKEFNHPVNFNTAQVTNMCFMFSDCLKFNQPVNFDTSKVTNMRGMFNECKEFNHPVNFNTAQVTDMSGMFNLCSKFNQPVNFDTPKVTNMSGMFQSCEEFNHPVNFNTAQVTDMSGMFNQCSKFDQPVNFDTSKVTNMQAMFRLCKEFNHPVNFNTAQVTDMSFMFDRCEKFNQPVNFYTSKVTNMKAMFQLCKEFNHPINFNTAQVTDMSGMFGGCKKFNQSVDFDTTKVTIMNKMFAGAQSLQNVKLQFNKVENIEAIFKDCYSLKTVDFSSLDKSKLKSYKDAIQDSGLLFNTKALNYKDNIQRLYTSVPTEETAQKIAIQVLKDGNKLVPRSLQELRILVHNNHDLDFADISTSKLGTLKGAFAQDYSHNSLNKHLPPIKTLVCPTWKNIDKLNVGHIRDFSHCFEDQSNFNVDISNWNTMNATNMMGMFKGCKEFNQPVNFDTREVIDMSSMFKGCDKLNQNLDLDVSKVTEFKEMFYDCPNFKSTLQLSSLNFDTLVHKTGEGLFNKESNLTSKVVLCNKANNHRTNQANQESSYWQNLIESLFISNLQIPYQKITGRKLKQRGIVRC